MADYIDGITDEATNQTYNALLEDEAAEWGMDDLDNESILEELDGGESPGGSATNDIIEQLRKTNPVAADRMAEMQREMSRAQNTERNVTEEWNGVRSEILGMREDMIAQKEAADEEASEDKQSSALPDNVTEDHLEMFQQMAEHFGYVPREEIQASEAESASDSHSLEAQERGVEIYGDSFGTSSESGDITVNPEIQDALNAKLEELTDPTKGLTPLDLYRLVASEKVATRRSNRAASRGPASRSSRASNVVRRSSPSIGTSINIRGNTPETDTSEDVLDRAWASSRRGLTQ